MTAASSKASRKPKPSPPSVKEKEEHATVPVRVSPTVHQFIIGKANWGESIDRTLRRLLHIPEGAHADANAR
jgi:hypothetical protein